MTTKASWLEELRYGRNHTRVRFLVRADYGRFGSSLERIMGLGLKKNPLTGETRAREFSKSEEDFSS
jgi:hypothetical protein